MKQVDGGCRRHQDLVLRRPVLERLATGKSGVDLVPIFDFGFAEFPAKKDFSAFPDGWEIDESAIEVLQLTSCGVDLGGERSNVTNQPEISGVYGHAAVGQDILSGNGMVVVGFFQLLTSGAKLAKPFGEKRDELVGFFDREETFLHASGV